MLTHRCSQCARVRRTPSAREVGAPTLRAPQCPLAPLPGRPLCPRTRRQGVGVGGGRGKFGRACGREPLTPHIVPHAFSALTTPPLPYAASRSAGAQGTLVSAARSEAVRIAGLRIVGCADTGSAYAVAVCRWDTEEGRQQQDLAPARAIHGWVRCDALSSSIPR